MPAKITEFEHCGPNRSSIGFLGVGAVLPAESISLNELHAAGLIRSEPQVLADAGFERAFIVQDDCTPSDLARQAAIDAIDDAGLTPEAIDLVIWASALPMNHLRAGALPTSTADPLPHFQYAAGWLQEELGLVNADVLAVTQQGCSTMFSALRTARAMIIAEPRVRNVLCVGADVLPAGSTREIMYNLISDSACAVVLSRESEVDRWVGFHQISRGYYWDPLARGAEIIAAYFPTSRAAIAELLDACELRPDQIDLLVPTGVNRNSWDILMRLTKIPPERLYRGTHSFGHTICADNFLLLKEIRRQGKLASGSRLLMFTYGFGSTWSSLLLEH